MNERVVSFMQSYVISWCVYLHLFSFPSFVYAGKSYWRHTHAFLLSLPCITCLQDIYSRAGLIHIVYLLQNFVPSTWILFLSRCVEWEILPLPCCSMQIDVAILEVGLGGRFDATNVVCFDVVWWRNQYIHIIFRSLVINIIL